MVAEYERAASDRDALNEHAVGSAPPLSPDETSSVSSNDGTLFEHCVRAIEKGLKAGVHGLRLWHRRLERRHESGGSGRPRRKHVAGFLLIQRAQRLCPLCDARADRARAARYRDEARRLASRLELAWDGEWYRRGYYDDGSAFGSSQNDECKIDSIA